MRFRFDWTQFARNLQARQLRIRRSLLHKIPRLKVRGATSTVKDGAMNDPWSMVEGGFLMAVGQWVFNRARGVVRPKANGSSARNSAEIEQLAKDVSALHGLVKGLERRLDNAGIW